MSDDKKLSRRDFLRVAGAGAAALYLGNAFGQKRGSALAANNIVKASPGYDFPKPMPIAKHIVHIYLDGGPSHIDMFDPKPDAGREYLGNYRNPIYTNVDDVMIGEKLPTLAKMADKYAIIRSMKHDTFGHETGHYYMTTGDMSKGELVYPSYTSVISYMKDKEYKGDLPLSVTLTEASTRFSESGFLGPRYKSFETGGQPDKENFTVEGILNKSIKDDELQRKKELLYGLNGLSEGIDHSTDVAKELAEYQARTYSLILGDSRYAFDLSKEPAKVRDKYGRTRFGQSCLAARRLIENGVVSVTLRYTGWDTHKQHFARMDERLMDIDKGVSSLISELEERGLLDETIIVCGGEFGRTPKIMWEPPWNGGRGHYGRAFSYIVAGGGFEGGKVIGKTDNKAENVIERPVYPADLIASIYFLMGIDPYGTIPYQTGAVPMLPSYANPKTSNGILKEIIPSIRA